MSYKELDKFIKSYNKCNDALIAYRDAYAKEMRVCGNQQDFYVYVLADNKDNKIFYVGKGSGNRYLKSQSVSLNSRDINHLKVRKIRQLNESGRSICSLLIADNLSEKAAYKMEGKLIEKLPDLVNINLNAVTQLQITEAFYENMKSWLLPFEEWWHSPHRPRHSLYKTKEEGRKHWQEYNDLLEDILVTAQKEDQT